MKLFRNNWENDFLEYLFNRYEESVLSCCKNCQFYKDLYEKYEPIDNTQYVETFDTGRIIHIDNIIPKICNICAFYY